MLICQFDVIEKQSQPYAVEVTKRKDPCRGVFYDHMKPCYLIQPVRSATGFFISTAAIFLAMATSFLL